MTAKEIWQKIKNRASANWGRVERFLASTVDGALTTWEVGWRALQTYVAVPKNFLMVTFGGILVYDIFSKGGNGSIAFLVKVVTDMLQSANGNGGWIIVAFTALFLMFQQNKK